MRHFQSSASNSVASGVADSAYDTESLPSYTLVSGLPSYDDALDCYRKTEVSASSRPSIMKLFAFDNPLLGSQLKESAASPDLQQVVVVDNKEGLPSYQESMVMVVDEQEKQKERAQLKKTAHKPILPFKAKNLTTQSISGSDSGHSEYTPPSTAGSEEEGSSLMGKFNFLSQQKGKRVDHLPQIHKSPSMVLVYDDEYWRNVHQNQQQTLSPSYSSNSLPRNFSAHLMNVV